LNFNNICNFACQVMTKYSRELGVTEGQWVDVFALDEESLATVPKPVHAVVFLFPTSDSVCDLIRCCGYYTKDGKIIIMINCVAV